MNKSLITLVTALMLGISITGCQQRYSEFTTHHADGRLKPAVAMLPIRDRSGDQVAWDIALELGESIKERLLQSGEVYVLKEDSLPPAQVNSPFGPDLSWAKAYRPAEFVAVLELVEHKRELVDGTGSTRPALEQPARSGYAIRQKMRVRLIDIRGVEPRLAYQELVQHRHLAPTNEARVDYQQVSYGSWKFRNSALAVAHQRLIDTVAERLQHYVIIEKANSPAL